MSYGSIVDIQDLGALGELVGGVAVVASVIYLTIQIRHGVAGYRSQVTLETTHHFSNLQLNVASSNELLSAWIKAEKNEPLSELEQRRVINIVSSYLIGFENMFDQSNTGTMARDGYLSRRPVIASMMLLTGVKDWWKKFGKLQFPPAFVEDVEQAMVDYRDLYR